MIKEVFNSFWPWYVAGPLIGLMVPVLLILYNKQFGISSTLRDFCSLVLPGKFTFFNYSIKEHLWRNFLVIGALAGGALATILKTDPLQVNISASTTEALRQLGITDLAGLVPDDIFSWSSLLSLKGLVFIVLGGFLVGFGTRWADGCTSGHAITGLSLMAPSSMLSVVGFFAGGLVATHILIPLIL
jgi:uncharacterized protein